MITAIVLLSPLAGPAQDGRAVLEDTAKAMGTSGLKSLEYTGTGVIFAVGQNATPNRP